MLYGEVALCDGDCCSCSCVEFVSAKYLLDPGSLFNASRCVEAM
jgi:hypothetical protein